MSPRKPTVQSNSEVATEHVFYDGDCGVCHWSVRFVATHDPDGAAFRFAPLGGDVFNRQLSDAQRRQLPDSLVVLTRSGEVQVQSGAVVHILKRLGGGWRLLGYLLSWMPRALRDLAYERFAANRHRLAAKPESTCPMPSPELRSRLDP